MKFTEILFYVGESYTINLCANHIQIYSESILKVQFYYIDNFKWAYIPIVSKIYIENNQKLTDLINSKDKEIKLLGIKLFNVLHE